MRLLRLLLLPLLVGTALPLRAQITLPVLSSYALPTGHSFIIGVTAAGDGVANERFRIATIAEIWAATSLDNAAWVKVDQPRNTNIPMTVSSLFVDHPDGQHYLITAPSSGSQAALYNYQRNPPSQTSVLLDGFLPGRLPTGLAVAPDQRFYLSTPSDIRVYPDLATGTATTVISNYGAQALGSLGAQLSFVNNTLYAFDQTNQRMLRYDAAGNFLNEFAVGHGSSGGSAFAASSTDLLFAADFYAAENPTGLIYRAATGDLLGYFDLPYDVDDPSSNSGRPFLTVVGDLLIATSGSGTNVYLYDLSAVPEPATYTALAGLLALGLAAWRRRR